MRSPLDQRLELVRAAHRLHADGFVANHDGNLTARSRGDRLLATPTAISKAAMREEWIVVVDLAGSLLEGRRKPFGELDLHLACYSARPELGAVCHAHPPVATAFGVAGVELAPLPLPEAVVSLGPIVPLLPLAAPKSAEGAAAVGRAIATADAILLAGNGAITVGADLDQALLRMELIEHLAKILLAARSLGGARPLPVDLVASLVEARRSAGLGSQKPPRGTRGAVAQQGGQRGSRSRGS